MSKEVESLATHIGSHVGNLYALHVHQARGLASLSRALASDPNVSVEIQKAAAISLASIEEILSTIESIETLEDHGSTREFVLGKVDTRGEKCGE